MMIMRKQESSSKYGQNYDTETEQCATVPWCQTPGTCHTGHTQQCVALPVSGNSVPGSGSGVRSVVTRSSSDSVRPVSDTTRATGHSLVSGVSPDTGHQDIILIFSSRD